jgi:hypothetical protein
VTVPAAANVDKIEVSSAGYHQPAELT